MPLLADIDADTGLFLGLTQVAVFACALWLVVLLLARVRWRRWQRPALRVLYALIAILVVSLAGLFLST